MSTSTAIGMVSESLRNLLAGEMKISPLPEVTVLAPDESTGNRSINLYLYKIIENPMLKNLDWRVKPGNPNSLLPPPLSLTLFYLMTPYSNNDSQTGNAPAHGMLGDAMRVFYENPVVPEQYLSTGLKNSREEIRVILNSLDLDELGKVWTTFSKAYRLSVLYEVSVVQLDMLADKEKIMANRVRTIGVPVIRAPYRVPEMGNMTPVIGSAGTPITFSGNNLSGWTPYIVVSGHRVTAISNLTDDGFQIALPSNLLPGFQEIQVNIGDKVRKTYLYEMKAPVLTGINPISGPEGTVVSIAGEALAGWVAYVSISRTDGSEKITIIGNSNDKLKVSNDTSFDVVITGKDQGIKPGSWKLNVELYKRDTPDNWDFDRVASGEFDFEVTA